MTIEQTEYPTQLELAVLTLCVRSAGPVDLDGGPFVEAARKLQQRGHVRGFVIPKVRASVRATQSGRILLNGLRCRVCGCGDLTACSTEYGPCSWVEFDLCSGCASPGGEAAA